MYGKIYGTMFTGSMYGAGPELLALMSYVIANTDPAHHIELNPQFLAPMFGMEIEAVERCIQKLCEPDPKSRTPTEEGRRILHVAGFTYFVVNHDMYRKIRNEDERREYFKMKQAESREKRKAEAVGDNPPPPLNIKAESNGKLLAEAKEILDFLNQHSGRVYRMVETNITLIRARLQEPDVTVAEMKKMIARQCAMWRGDEKMDRYLRPETLFNKTKFDSYYAARDLPVIPKGQKPHWERGEIQEHIKPKVQVVGPGIQQPQLQPKTA